MDLREYISFIDKEMVKIVGQMEAPTEIFDYLYLGTEWNASNFEELKKKGINKILNVSEEIDNFFPGNFQYCNVRVNDEENTELLRYWDSTFKYIEDARQERSKVLVHCRMGISRSASVVIAYIMKIKNWSLQESINYVKSKRKCINPNTGFLQQLEVYQGILNASKQRHYWRSKSENSINSVSSSPPSKPTINSYHTSHSHENSHSNVSSLNKLIIESPYNLKSGLGVKTPSLPSNNFCLLGRKLGTGKLQQGKSHPLTKLVPLRSQTGPFVNTK